MAASEYPVSRVCLRNISRAFVENILHGRPLWAPDIPATLVTRLKQGLAAFDAAEWDKSQITMFDILRDIDIYTFGPYDAALWLVPCGKSKFIDCVAKTRLWCYVFLISYNIAFIDRIGPEVFATLGDKRMVQHVGQETFDFIEKARKLAPPGSSATWRAQSTDMTTLLELEAMTCRRLATRHEITPLMTTIGRCELMYGAFGAIEWAISLDPANERLKDHLRVLEMWRDDGIAQT